MISKFNCYKQVENPDMYLCNPNQEMLYPLNATDRNVTLRYNDLSEMTFSLSKALHSEEAYNEVKARKLVFVEDLGWFQITSTTERVEGDKFYKDVTLSSHQSTLKERGFVVEERVYMFYNPNDPYDEEYTSGDANAIPSVVGQLYKQLGIKAAIKDEGFEPTEDFKNWTIIYISQSLKFKAKSSEDKYTPEDGAENICRSFDASTSTNGYEFIVNQVEEAFEVIFEFDFLHHTIKVKTMEDILDNDSNIYLSSENVINSLNISEEAEDIVTVLKCSGDDLDIRTINPTGTDYIVNFDYYATKKWMSDELIKAIGEWKETVAGKQDEFTKAATDLRNAYEAKEENDNKITNATLKLKDLQAAIDQYNEDPDGRKGYSVNAETVLCGETSLFSKSKYNEVEFNDGTTITAYTTQPTYNGKTNEFEWSGDSKEDTPKNLIKDYIDTEITTTSTTESGDLSTEEGGENTSDGSTNKDFYLFFSDETSETPESGETSENSQTPKSYCKLVISTKVGVVKTDDGLISRTGGKVTLNDTVFLFEKKDEGGNYTVGVKDGENYKEIKTAHEDGLSNTHPYFTYGYVRYRIAISVEGIITVYYYYIAGFDRFTTYNQIGGEGGWYSIWESYITNTLEEAKENQENTISEKTDELEEIASECNIQSYMQNKGQGLYDELNNYWIEGSYSNSNFAVSDTTTLAEKIDLAKELLAAAEKDLEKSSQPKYTLSIDAINFLKIIEFKPFTDELKTGKIITIEKEDGVHYNLFLVSIQYNLDTPDNFSLTFSNASNPNETAMTFADLFQEVSSVSRTVSASWSNLMDYSNNKEEITSLIENPLNSTLRAAKANMTKQNFIIDDQGILGRKRTDDSKTTFDDHQIRILNNVMLFTRDKWDTAALALGEVNIGDKKYYGLVAEALVGKVILGEQMKIGNEDGSVLINDEGIKITNGNAIVFNATNGGDLSITGDITATSLTLKKDVPVVLENSSGEVVSGFIFKIEEVNGQKVASLNTNANTISLSGGQISISSDNFSIDNTGIIAWQSKEEEPFFKINKDGTYIKTSNFEVTPSLFKVETPNFTLTQKEETNDGGTISKVSSLVINTDNFKIDEDGNVSIGGGVEAKSVHIGDLRLANIQSLNKSLSYALYMKSNDLMIGMRASENDEGRPYESFITFGGTDISEGDNTLGMVSDPPSGITTYIDRSGIEVGTLWVRTLLRMGSLAFGDDYITTISQKEETNPTPKIGITRIPAGEVQYVANLSRGNNKGEIIISLTDKNGNAYTTNSALKFTVWYALNWWGGDHFTDIEIPVGASKVTYNYGGDLGIHNVWFDPTKYPKAEDDGKTLTVYADGNSYMVDIVGNTEIKGGLTVSGDINQTVSSTINSDKGVKTEIEPIPDVYTSVYDLLQPVRYKLKNGESGRYHTGFVAQDVKASVKSAGLSTNDLAAYCEWTSKEGETTCGLRYEEFIALNTQQIQKLKSRVAELEQVVNDLKRGT